MRKLVLLFVFFYLAQLSAYVSDADKQNFATYNLLKNGGFENGKAGWIWSGTYTTWEVQSATVGDGKYSARYDADRALSYIISDDIVVPSALAGNNGILCVKYKGGAGGDYNIQIMEPGAVVNAETTLPGSTDWTDECLNFVFPSSGNINFRLDPNSSITDDIYLDNVFIGDANRVNISNVSQAEFVGYIEFEGATNCVWTTTSATYASFAADPDCNNATVVQKSSLGTLTSSAKVPKIEYNNAPEGTYLVLINNSNFGTSASDTSTRVRLYDGTTQGAMNILYGQTSGVTIVPISLSATYTYTSSGNRYWELQGMIPAAKTLSVYNNGTMNSFKIEVYRFPTSSQQAINPSTQMVASGVKIAADAAHVFSTTSASYAKATDPDVVSADKTHFGTATETTTAGDFGFKIPYLKANTEFLVYANISLEQVYASSSGYVSFVIYDGTTEIAETSITATPAAARPALSYISGTITYDSVQTDKEFTIYAKRVTGGGSALVNIVGSKAEIGIIPLTEGMNNPHILNNVVSSSSDGVRVSSADLNCDAGSAITAQDGSWISSIGNISSGVCAVTLTSGTFSSTPNCSCSKQGATLDENSRADATTTTNVNLYGIVSSTGLALTSFDCELICVGGK